LFLIIDEYAALKRKAILIQSSSRSIPKAIHEKQTQNNIYTPSMENKTTSTGSKLMILSRVVKNYTIGKSMKN
jgi:hypothetical protein